MSKAVVLLSGGLDSSTNLFAAAKEHEIVLSLTANYGQRAANREIDVSRKLSTHLGLAHKVMDLAFVSDFGKSALTDVKKKIPSGVEVEIDNKPASMKSAQRVWVPNRNGILLNVAAGFAESLGAEYVIPGFNLEEAQTFPDNSAEFIEALSASFFFSTANRVRVKCYTSSMTKTEIVRLALGLKVPLEKLWPCYEDVNNICRLCESCQRFLRATREVGVEV